MINNSYDSVLKFIITLAELYPGDTSEVKARTFAKLLADDLRAVNLSELLEKLANQFKFFPSIVEIKDTLGIKKQTRRELATEFIDTMLAVMNMNVNIYEHAGSDNCRFWQEVTGFSAGTAKNDLQAGKLDTRFLRGQWIDRAERAYIEHDNKKQLEAAESIARLTGDKPDDDQPEGEA